jgi:hypothetical protein
MNQTVTQLKLRRIFRASLNLANLVEDILERSGDFDPVFQKGLRRSIKEATQGKTRTVRSLRELV